MGLGLWGSHYPSRVIIMDYYDYEIILISVLTCGQLLIPHDLFAALVLYSFKFRVKYLINH